MRARTTLTSALIAVALVGGLLMPAQADDLDDQAERIDQRIEDSQHALEGASRRLRAAAASLAETRSQLPIVQARLTEVRTRKETARVQLEIVRQRLRELRAQQSLIQHEIDAAERRIERTEGVMGQLVRHQYQSGGLVELQVVLAADDAADFLQTLATAQQVLDQQGDVVDQLTADKAVLSARIQQMQVTVDAIEIAEAEAIETFRELKQLAREAREARDELAALHEQRQAALRVARNERQAELARLERLEAEQEAIAQQIAEATSNSGGQMPGGELRWPTPGPMVQGVGWRVHPVYGYQSCHTGIDISAPSGQAIVAARGGVVVWTVSDLSGPYGNYTLIDHGGGLSTFYAHQTSFAVSPGEHVDAGETIGYVGSTGYSTGPHLHFEVHVDGVPHDPMGWYGGSKTPQSSFCP